VKQSPWPWAIGLGMAAVLAGVIAFSVRSIRGGVDLVAPDYYAQEVRHQARIEATRRTLALGTNALVAWEAGRLFIEVPSAAGATGTVTFYRPSDARMDQRLALALDGEGRQEADAPLAAGLWRLQAEWTSDGDSYYAEKAFLAP
jgi:nitrogen fixation protein FixH